MERKLTLSPEQKEAASELDRNLQIIACAGSGKTEVITQRIAAILRNRPDVKPENIVAFTFTEKAAETLKERITNALGTNSEEIVDKMYIGTIHSFCYHLLQQYTEQFRNHKILDTVKLHLFVTRYWKECGMADLGLEVYPRNIDLFLQCIDKMIDDYDHSHAWTQEQRTVLEQYISCLYQRKYIDFSLLIFETLRQIESCPALREYLSHIRYLVVDEYQDVDDLQEKLISRIAQAGANICVVGDDDQTIYQFRGSNAHNMISFSEHYSNVHQVRLEKNYRCAPGIVDVADRVIAHNTRRILKKMVSAVTEETAEVKALRSDSKQEQFDSIAGQIARLHTSGIPYNEIAILVRKGKIIPALSASLEGAGIPFKTDSAERFFADAHFNRLVTTLQILSDINKAKLYECWQDLLDANAIHTGFKFLRSCARGGRQPLSKILSDFCETICFLDESVPDLEARRTAFEGITTILNDYDEIYGDWQLTARITGVLKFLATRAAEEYKYHSFSPKDPHAETVQIMTVHKAKGLEFQVVFLPELIQREFPVSNLGGKRYWHVLGGTFEENKNKYQSSVEDERKLFYVAVTRAKQKLYLTYELSSQPISCFVQEVAESPYLSIDRSDLTDTPKGGGEMSRDSFTNATKTTEFTSKQEEKRERQEYWAAVRYARKQLYDYYGTGAHFCPAMHSVLSQIKAWTPEQILEDAARNGLI